MLNLLDKHNILFLVIGAILKIKLTNNRLFSFFNQKTNLTVAIKLENLFLNIILISLKKKIQYEAGLCENGCEFIAHGQ